MCVDGMKQERELVGSGYIDFISGLDIQTSTATIATTAGTTGSFVTANITTLNAVTLKAGSATLSSGSRWVVFNSPFANANYHVVANGFFTTGWVNAAPVITTGSHVAGSFVALGSLAAAADVFSWIAVPSQL